MTGKRLPFRVIPPMDNQLVTKLEHFPAQVANVSSLDHIRRAIGVHIARRRLLILHQSFRSDYGHVIPRNFSLQLPEHLMISQKLVDVVHVDLIHALDHLDPQSLSQLLVLQAGDLHDAPVRRPDVHQVGFEVGEAELRPEQFRAVLEVLLVFHVHVLVHLLLVVLLVLVVAHDVVDHLLDLQKIYP